MKTLLLKALSAAALGGLPLLSVAAELPPRDLIVLVREVESASGVSVGTQSPDLLLEPQQVRVRNGAKARLRLSQSLPIQWVASVSAQSSAFSGSGVKANSSGGSVENAVTWMDAGQSLTVQPRWPGGQKPVELDIELQSAAVGNRVGSELPTQSRSQLSTTVSAPLGEWVMLARTGSSSQPGVYGTESMQTSPRMLQIRVLAP
jgi:hypothetical protein